MNTARNDLKSKILKTLKIANKQKIIIIFDDFDRVADSKSIFFFLKTITYIIDFDNVLSITGVDLEKLLKYLYGDDKETVRVINRTKEEYNSLAYARSTAGISDTEEEISNKEKEKYSVIPNLEINNKYYDYIWKVFTSVIDLPSFIKQNELKEYFLNFCSPNYFYNDEKVSFIEYFLLEHNFGEERTKIIEHLKRFIDSEYFYDETQFKLFVNFREIKLTVNDFLSKLLILKGEEGNYTVTDRISPVPVFLLSLIKVIDPYFYYNFLKYIQNVSTSNDLSLIIEKIFESKYRLELPANYERIRKILLLLEIGKNRRSNLSFEPMSNIGFALNVPDMLKNNISYPIPRNFYINPVIEDFQFRYGTELENHFYKLYHSPDILTDIRLKFKQKRIDYYNQKLMLFEVTTMIEDYLFNFRNYLEVDIHNAFVIKDEINLTFYQIIDFITRVFVNVNIIIEEFKLYESKYFENISLAILNTFDLIGTSYDKFKIVESNFYFSEINEKNMNVFRVLNIIIKKSDLLLDELINIHNNKRQSLLYLNLLPLIATKYYGIYLESSKANIDNIILIDKKTNISLFNLEEPDYENMSLIKFILSDNRLRIMDSLHMNWKSLSTQKEININFRIYYSEEYSRYYSLLDRIIQDRGTKISKQLLNTIIDSLKNKIIVDGRDNKFNITFNPTNFKAISNAIEFFKSINQEKRIIEFILFKGFYEKLQPIYELDNFCDNKPITLNYIVDYFEKMFEDNSSLKKIKVDVETNPTLGEGFEALKKYNEFLKNFQITKK